MVSRLKDRFAKEIKKWAWEEGMNSWQGVHWWVNTEPCQKRSKCSKANAEESLFVLLSMAFRKSNFFCNARSRFECKVSTLQMYRGKSANESLLWNKLQKKEHKKKNQKKGCSGLHVLTLPVQTFPEDRGQRQQGHTAQSSDVHIPHLVGAGYTLRNLFGAQPDKFFFSSCSFTFAGFFFLVLFDKFCTFCVNVHSRWTFLGRVNRIRINSVTLVPFDAFFWGGWRGGGRYF